MGKVADLIDRILELESKGKTRVEIGAALGLKVAVVNNYRWLRESPVAKGRIARIKKAMAEGYKTSSRIEERTGISRQQIRSLIAANRIGLQQDHTTIVDRVEADAEQGLTLDEILTKNKTTRARLSHYYPLDKLSRTYQGLRHKTAVNLITRLLNDDEDEDLTIYRIYKETNLDSRMIGRVVQEEIVVDGKKTKLIEFLYDSFVLDGLPSPQIVELTDFNSKARVHQYLIDTKQKEKWDAMRAEKATEQNKNHNLYKKT